MSAKRFFDQETPTRIGLTLARLVPRWLAGIICRLLAVLGVLIKTDVYRAITANLRHVLPDASPRTIAWLRYRAFYNAARAYYDFFHNVATDKDPSCFVPPVRLAPGARERFDQALEQGRGVLVLGCHVSNFDLGGEAMPKLLGLKSEIQYLSIANPTPSMAFFNRLRESQPGIRITPVSPASLKQAIRHLRAGGVVTTGMDRPLDENDEPVVFFGFPTRLPCGYLRLQRLSGCVVIAAGAHYAHGYYEIDFTGPLPWSETGDAAYDDEVNKRTVLSHLEAFIRRAPDQWMMFVPVWPDEHD